MPPLQPITGGTLLFLYRQDLGAEIARNQGHGLRLIVSRVGVHGMTAGRGQDADLVPDLAVVGEGNCSWNLYRDP